MAGGTKIEWADETWNPIVGCSRVSVGCDNCYAVPTVHRGMAEQHRGLTVHTEGEGTDWTGEVRVVDKRMDVPLRWTRPRRIFVNSLSDLFHPGLDDVSIARVFAVMSLAPQHTFQVLTKRPQRMRDLLTRGDVHTAVTGRPRKRSLATLVDLERQKIAGSDPGDFYWPLQNVWLGVSIESNQYAWRANWLRDTPAAVRWVSAEPLLGPLDQLDLTGIDWVVAGGESGPGSRPMASDWARELRDRCTGSLDATDPRPAFLFKQWGDWRTQHGAGETLPARWVWVNVETGETATDRRVGGRWVRAYRYGKVEAGRSLDGRTWDEYPA